MLIKYFWIHIHQLLLQQEEFSIVKQVSMYFQCKEQRPMVLLWDVKQLPNRKYANWVTSNRRVNRNQYDSALVINITRNIYNEVVEFIKESNSLIGRIFNCTLNGLGATNFSIENGTHASILASGVYDIIGKRSIEERRGTRGTLHIFASAPNAFMFFLGQNSAGFGKCILYEYDFEHRNTCTYSKSISFMNE